jgi:transcriptional regulator with XRE-family HTH domain
MDLSEEHIAPSDRGGQLIKWRRSLGWSVGDIAKILDVSERTIALWESSRQAMPDVRWRLLMHEVRAEIARIESGKSNRELVVIISEDQAPLDVVSSENYAGYVISDDGRTGLVASYSVNRQTNAPAVHRQRFPVGPNKHAVTAFERWEESAKSRAMNTSAFQMERWLMRRVLAGELANPKLTTLKEEINIAKAKLDEASDASEDMRRNLLRDLDVAIANLMEAVAKITKTAG